MIPVKIIDVHDVRKFVKIENICKPKVFGKIGKIARGDQPRAETENLLH